MTEPFLHTATLHHLVDRIQEGDAPARDELVRRVAGRLEFLARRMLGSFPDVRAWEQTDDVLQNALLRLLRSLEKLKPADTRAFLGLAAEELRRELIDLHRHYHRSRRPGKNVLWHEGTEGRPSIEPADPNSTSENLEGWQAFHEAVSQLPPEEREVFGLVFYHGWAKPEIAKLLHVTDRTVRRYWQSACLRLNDLLNGNLPID